MRETRDKRFYALQQKERSNVAHRDRRAIGYRDKMLQLGVARKARRMWVDIKAELEAR